MLKKSNYSTWKFCISMLLQKDKFQDIVESNPQGVVILEEGELHDEAKKDIHGKKTKHVTLFTRSKFS